MKDLEIELFLWAWGSHEYDTNSENSDIDFEGFLNGEMVKYKKYVYALRPILAFLLRNDNTGIKWKYVL